MMHALETNEDQWSIFPLTENLSNSYVDPSNLIANVCSNQNPIGMENFRAKAQNRASNKFTNSISMPSNCFQFHQQKGFLSQSPLNGCLTSSSVARLRWKSAACKAIMMPDPWLDFKIESYPAENVIRHRYNAIKKQWIKDECMVKIEPEKFANGAMRACFRLKKLSNFVHKKSWEHAANYVAKCYMNTEEITRERYFDDVKLQMDAKLWAEIYNQHNPPKKIDMFQMSVLEFKDRPDSPLFHLEHFIEGTYIKYNSNSGFVEDVHVRLTPQAFSHFTFESSNHELIVVDIQGVGDLYTDPQIHTIKGTEYGDGNLGVKGFALFFSSHICNDVCRGLGLTQFDLSDIELKTHTKMLSYMQKFHLTQSRGSEEVVVGSPTSLGEYFRQRTRSRSDNSVCSDENSNMTDLPEISESEGYDSASQSPLISPYNSVPLQIQSSRSMAIPIGQNPVIVGLRTGGRVRNESHCLDSAFSMDEAVNYFNSKKAAFNKPRPSCVNGEKNYIMNNRANQQHREEDDYDDGNDDTYSSRMHSRLDDDDDLEESILGKIHLELCKYHEMGRFLKDDSEEFDSDSAFFHLKQAANLGVNEAMTNLAKIFLNLPRDILANYNIEESDENLDIGFDYMQLSADKGDKNSMFFIAKTLDTGNGISKNKSIDWLKSLEYYQRVVNVSDEEPSLDAGYMYEVNNDCDPIYSILARMGEMNLKGGYGLEQDLSEAVSLFTDAGEKAMAFGKGRIANKYYMLAEQASAMCDDDF